MKATEVIYLNRRDSVETVRELLASATPGAQVWLVAPWGMRLANDLLRLKLIARVARHAGLDLRLVSAHANTRVLAREAGIPTYAWVPLGLRKYRRKRRDDAQGLAARVLPVDSPPVRGRRRPKHLGLGQALIALAGTLLVMGLAAGALLLFIPEAQVSLHPVVLDEAVTFRVTANPRLVTTDYGRAIVPARRVQVIVTGRTQVPASGSVEQPGDRAAGEVVLINRTQESVTIPKGTVVRSASGRVARFFTVSDVVLPARLYAHQRVGIVAMEPGLSSNVGALTITVVEGELANRVEVINDSPTSGGTVQLAPVVMADDFNRLRDELVDQLEVQAYEELKAIVEEGEFIPPQTIEVLVMSQKWDQTIGQQSEVVSGEMRVVANGLVIDGNALNDLAGRMVEAQAEEDYRLIKDSLLVIRSPEAEYTGDVFAFEVVARGSLGPAVTEEQVQTWLRGKDPEEAIELLADRIELVDEPLIRVVPGWWHRLPLLSGRVEVLMTVAG
ncbi:MAG: hypothetical protein ACOX2R_12245 [Anaerolineae bacterium]